MHRSMMWSLAASMFALSSIAAPAQTNVFYQGKTIQLIVPFSPGGYYDVSSRLLAKYLPREIQGQPTIVVQNQPGGGGLTAANRLANSIPRDGLSIAAIGRGIPQLALLKEPGILFDPLQLTWLGSLSDFSHDAHLLVVNQSSKVRSTDDAKRLSLHLGGGAAGSTNITFARLARDLFGFNVEVVRGFPGSNDIWLAMERGEVDGQLADLSGIMTARSESWHDGKLRPLIQFGRRDRLPSLQDVPTGRELASSIEDLALLQFAEIPFFMSLAFAAPPAVPHERAQSLRAAFMKVARDPEFVKDMSRAGIAVDAVDGDAVMAVLEAGALTSAKVKERFARLLKD